MEELNKIPEQHPLHDWSISKEFCNLIDRLPYYSGVIYEDGKSVELGFMRSCGFDPVIPLDTYIKGAVYATLKSKLANTYVPAGLETKVQERINIIFKDEFRPFTPVPFYCSVKEKLEDLAESDACK